ncbi:MAG: prephenate dehydrogenase/arogenate dehydrogenase family protein [Candidatus Helarchaeota archaeon]
MYKTIIIGGTGGMGKLISYTFKDDLDIYISSRHLNKAQKIAEELGVNYCSKKDYSNADIIIVSVPINETLANCEKVIPLMKEGSLLMEISSVKTGIVDQLKVPKNIEYISVHPLFGPLGSFNGQNVILIPVQVKKWLEIIKNIFEKKGSIVSLVDYQEHDKIMGNVQVIHHFSYLCLGIYLAENTVPKEFFTRSFKKTVDSFKNYETNLKIMVEIQKLNPFTKSVREKFANLVAELSKLPDDEFESKIINGFKKLYQSYD